MPDSIELTVKQRMQIKRQKMPQQPAAERIKNFKEVSLGYTVEQARKEAERCIQCKTPKCINGCPVAVPIPQFIKAIHRKNYKEAINIIKSTNNLPAICGRVCPQETQCEEACVLARKQEPVAIGRLERFAADWELSQGVEVPTPPQATPYKVAVIGSGPAGLTCAGDLAKHGHQVTIFEALHLPGGVLNYGIPEFRLPLDIVKTEVDYVKKLGVEVKTDHVIGKSYSLDDIFDELGFDALFLGTGAGLPIFLRIPGENYIGVYSANEFLTRVNLMQGYKFPEWDTPVKIGSKIAVIGAGNVAMDAARCALRLGTMNINQQVDPPEVYIVYRRSEKEMPARVEEIENAKAEGVIFKFLTNPIEIHGSKDGRVCGMRCVSMELGEPDDSGRRRPIPIPGSEYDMEVDMVIVALGTRPNPIVFSGAGTLQRTRWGTVEADQITGKTTKEKVWAGGDIVTGAATVISAMGAARRAAEEIDKYLWAIKK